MMWQPGQSGGKVLIPDRFPALGRHDKGSGTRLGLHYSAIPALSAKKSNFTPLHVERNINESSFARSQYTVLFHADGYHFKNLANNLSSKRTFIVGSQCWID